MEARCAAHETSLCSPGNMPAGFTSLDVRNYSTFHRLFRSETTLVWNLWIGNHEGVTYLFEFTSGFPLIDPCEYNQLGEIHFMQEKQRIAFQIYSRPILFNSFGYAGRDFIIFGRRRIQKHG